MLVDELAVGGDQAGRVRPHAAGVDERHRVGRPVERGAKRVQPRRGRRDQNRLAGGHSLAGEIRDRGAELGIGVVQEHRVVEAARTA